MPNILFLTHWYPTPEMPIYGTFIREHARAVARYHPVTLIHVQGVDSSLSGTYQFNRQENGNLTEIHMKYRKHSFPRMTWLRRFRGVDQIVKELNESGHKPDVIHANIFSSSDLAAFLSYRYKIPAVLSENATNYPRRQFGRLQAIKVRFCNNRLARILPVSEDLARHMQAFGIRTRCQIVPNVVDTSCFYPTQIGERPDRAKPRILVVARLDPVKGVGDFLAALDLLSSRGKDFTAGLVGYGSERQKLENLVHQLNLEDRVTFYGTKSREEVAELLRQADLLALTSYWENLPVVILEALASGLPVVASSVGGVAEVVKPELGVLTEPGNVESIASGLTTVMENLDDYDNQAIARYAQSHFSYEAVGRQFSQIYGEVIKEYES
ncbi:MAG: glycosyltransferase [Anaerolineales bacterium]|jgi:glycosyltransferase involved in cell wall biosynthesis